TRYARQRDRGEHSIDAREEVERRQTERKAACILVLDGCQRARRRGLDAQGEAAGLAALEGGADDCVVARCDVFEVGERAAAAVGAGFADDVLGCYGGDAVAAAPDELDMDGEVVGGDAEDDGH
ncbi:hypothetical protein V496_07235, partial [Pseudogymnoascus sp. VKM F-4515 (FW-2607)]